MLSVQGLTAFVLLALSVRAQQPTYVLPRPGVSRSSLYILAFWVPFVCNQVSMAVRIRLNTLNS